VLTEEKLDDIEARFEHTPRKSLKRLAQETGVSKSSARTATQLLKLGPYKTAIHVLQRAIQLAVFVSAVDSCSLHVEGEIDPQLTFFSDEAWFRLQGYTNRQNNSYWISQNPHEPTKPRSIQ
jgi:hypothetical protein